jgi:hypothetical protein
MLKLVGFSQIPDTRVEKDKQGRLIGGPSKGLYASQKSINKA